MAKDPVPEGWRFFLLGDTEANALALRSFLMNGEHHRRALEELKKLDEGNYWNVLQRSAIEGGGDPYEDARLTDRLWSVRWERDAAILGLCQSIDGAIRSVERMLKSRYGSTVPEPVSSQMAVLNDGPISTVRASAEAAISGSQPKISEDALVGAWIALTSMLDRTGALVDPRNQR